MKPIVIKKPVIIRRKVSKIPTKKDVKKASKVLNKTSKKVKDIKKLIKKAPKGPKKRQLVKKLTKAQIIKGGRSWVNTRTKTLKDKIKRNKVLIKSSTDQAKITVW